MRQKYAKGIGWGYVKEDLFQLLDGMLAAPRERYKELMKDTTVIDDLLSKGAARARPQAQELLQRVRRAIGVARN